MAADIGHDQAEFMRPLFDQREDRQFIRQLKALQDVFGYINDARMTPRLVEIQQERRAGSDAGTCRMLRSWPS